MEKEKRKHKTDQTVTSRKKRQHRQQRITKYKHGNAKTRRNMVQNLHTKNDGKKEKNGKIQSKNEIDHDKSYINFKKSGKTVKN